MVRVIARGVLLFLCVGAGALSPFVGATRAQESVVVEGLTPSPIDAQRIERDIAAVERSKSAAIIRFSTRSGAKSALPDVPVPVFMPRETISDFEKSADALPDGGLKSGGGPGEVASRFIPHADGYVVSRRFPAFDLVVRGTNQVFTGSGGSKSAAQPEPDFVSEVSEIEGGLSFTFRYAGADYVVDLECRDGSGTCVAAGDAERLFQDFVMCGFDDRCVERGATLIRKDGRP
jgi:hypothetical protein